MSTAAHSRLVFRNQHLATQAMLELTTLGAAFHSVENGLIGDEHAVINLVANKATDTLKQRGATLINIKLDQQNDMHTYRYEMDGVFVEWVEHASAAPRRRP